MTPQELIKHVESRCRDDAGCWVWLGCLQKCGTTPVMKLPGSRKVVQVRRVLMEAKGVKVAGKVTTYTCESPRCVHPDHTAVMTRGELQSRTNRNISRAVRLKRNKLITERRRRTAKLTPEIVALIRQSPMPRNLLARYLGVRRCTIDAVFTGRSWAEPATSNPFAGLFRL